MSRAWRDCTGTAPSAVFPFTRAGSPTSAPAAQNGSDFGPGDEDPLWKTRKGKSHWSGTVSVYGNQNQSSSIPEASPPSGFFRPEPSATDLRRWGRSKSHLQDSFIRTRSLRFRSSGCDEDRWRSTTPRRLLNELAVPGRETADFAAQNRNYQLTRWD